jgi:glycosyltransferase involved in cell wall biosynthesis
MTAEATSNTPRPKRLVCIVNGIYSTQLGGGDIYFSYIARAAIEAGYKLHCFGGHAFKEYLERMEIPATITLTDSRKENFGSVASLQDQARLLWDFAKRCWNSLWTLDVIQPEDCVYAMSDYWFDSIPLMLCRARSKIMYLGMMAPTLREVITRGRADVTASRLNSLYYWASQQFSVRLFRFSKRKMFTYGHPEMRAYLKRFGYRDDELADCSNGMDVEAADRVPERPKQFDIAWTGRVHPQKGIDDLLATIPAMVERFPDFRAMIIGKSKDVLAPKIEAMGLSKHVTFSGLVSEDEKFRLLKASRLFVMPSRYESWGIVIGEALAAGVPVVGYDLTCYRPVFGDFVRYVRCFDRNEWLRAVEQTVAELRTGKNYFDAMPLNELKQSLSWKRMQQSFQAVLRKMCEC